MEHAWRNACSYPRYPRPHTFGQAGSSSLAGAHVVGPFLYLHRHLRMLTVPSASVLMRACNYKQMIKLNDQINQID